MTRGIARRWPLASLVLLTLLSACTEKRVIRDNSPEARLQRSMNASSIERAGQSGNIH